MNANESSYRIVALSVGCMDICIVIEDIYVIRLFDHEMIIFTFLFIHFIYFIYSIYFIYFIYIYYTYFIHLLYFV